MMKPDAHDRAYQPVTLDQARKILAQARRAYPRGLTPSQAASLLWPDKTFLSAQGAARAAAGVLSALKRQGHAGYIGPDCRWYVK